jgi:carbon monoxide dehydrogenase subunit G
MPGVQSLEVVDDTTFTAVVAQRVGLFRTQFDLSLSLTEVDPPRRLVATGQGKEAGGSLLKVSSAVIELEVLAEDRTRLSFEIDFSLLGKLGTLGYPVVKHKAGDMARQFADNLRKEMEDELH